jgi:outer membrane protease
MTKLLLFAGLLCGSVAVQAQEREFGIRYWHSNGTTTRSHNAQVVQPNLGNPTSVLTYDGLKAPAVELHARVRSRDRWFLRGTAGLGWIRKGSFDDEDFNAGQSKFSDSTSPVKGNRLYYGTVDIGRDLWVLGEGGSTVGLFAGYGQWVERLDAYGATFTVNGLGNANIADSVPVITNEVTWHALRLGIVANARLTQRTRLTIDATWVPYAQVRDEDSHYLRTSPSDLGPVPNIIMEGRGNGVQLDLELRHFIRDQWEIGAGWRYWRLRATHGTREAAGTSVPVTELESQRSGFIMSVTRRW